MTELARNIEEAKSTQQHLPSTTSNYHIPKTSVTTLSTEFIRNVQNIEHIPNIEHIIANSK
jgi:hypothetical protein